MGLEKHKKESIFKLSILVKTKYGRKRSIIKLKIFLLKSTSKAEQLGEGVVVCYLGIREREKRWEILFDFLTASKRL